MNASNGPYFLIKYLASEKPGMCRGIVLTKNRSREMDLLKFALIWFEIPGILLPTPLPIEDGLSTATTHFPEPNYLEGLTLNIFGADRKRLASISLNSDDALYFFIEYLPAEEPGMCKGLVLTKNPSRESELLKFTPLHFEIPGVMPRLLLSFEGVGSASAIFPEARSLEGATLNVIGVINRKRLASITMHSDDSEE